MKKGFTIVELLMVVTVIAVLLGIVTTAAQASMRAARERKAQAMKSILQGGLAVYHRQNDKWPDAIEPYADKGESHTLNAGEYDDVMKELLEQSTGVEGKNPLMDPTGLMVMRKGTPDGNAIAKDFRAVVTDKKSSLKVDQMTVVYPSTDSGKAKRFTIHYNAAIDSATVN